MNVFEEFQENEYAKIADAHFNTNSAIASFFKYYLALMAIPISALGVVAASALKDASTSEAVLREAKPLLAICFVVVGSVGFLIMLYVANLRFDALLYARTVNSIRKFFYDRADLGFLYKRRLSVLPQDPNQPAYFEKGYFLVVILAFALLDGLYIAFAGVVFVETPKSPLLSFASAADVVWWWWEVVVITIVAHPLLYWRFSKARETKYLAKRAVAVDIDGVLNKHREHFCAILAKKGLGSLSPAAIKALPVHRTPGLGITREQEIAVFQDPDYWLQMPAVDDAAKHLKDIRRLGIEVIAVTTRPWPIHDNLTLSRSRELTAEWRKRSMKLALERGRFAGFWHMCVSSLLGRRPIYQFTKHWLKENDMPVDELVVEGGESSRWLRIRARFSNRIELARARGVRFFVEDDPVNAMKLASVCEVVFLFDQPYNAEDAPSSDLSRKHPFEEALPDNVVRVSDWDHIYQLVRRLV